MKGTFASDLARVAISNIAIILFGLGTSIITGRYLGPEKNGIIAALLVYPSLFMTIGSLGIRQSTTYFLGKKIYDEERIKRGITQIWFLTSVFSVIICFFLMHYLSKSGQNLTWVLLALIPIPFSLFNTYNSGIFLGKNQIKKFNKINWLPVSLTFLLTAVLVVIFPLQISGSLLAMLGGPLIMFSILLFKNDFLGSFSFKIDWTVIKSLLSLGIIYAIALLVINLNYKIDVIILDKLSTPYQLGIYSKGANIIQYLWQIPMVLSTIVFSRSAISQDDHAFSLKVAQLLRMSLILVGGISIVLYFLSKFVILTMYGNKFYDSISVLNILLPGVVLLTIFKVMNMDLAGKGKPWVSMKAMIPALIINIFLNLLWVPEYGANGSSYASTISYTVASLLFIYFYCVETRITIKELFKFKRSDFKPLLNIIKY
jgi:O-antigen/teichoic acid export membrane protein